jgi:hypothetical protein
MMMKLHYAIVANEPEDPDLRPVPPIGSIVGVPEHVWPKYEGTKVFVELKNEPQQLSSLDYPKLYAAIGDTFGPATTLLNAQCRSHTIFLVPPFRDPFREILENRLFHAAAGGLPVDGGEQVHDAYAGTGRGGKIVH